MTPSRGQSVLEHQAIDSLVKRNRPGQMSGGQSRIGAHQFIEPAFCAAGEWGHAKHSRLTQPANVTTLCDMERTQSLDIRVSPEEKALIRAAAERDARKMSDWVRLVVLKAAKEIGK